MATRFNRTRLATAVTTAALGLGLSTAANAVVVVGGDNGWEVSFDGNINAFYVQGDYDAGYNGLGLNAPTSNSTVTRTRTVGDSVNTTTLQPSAATQAAIANDLATAAAADGVFFGGFPVLATGFTEAGTNGTAVVQDLISATPVLDANGNVQSISIATQNSGGGSTFAGRPLDSSRVTSGFLPAFFSFNVKSPTVNGMTGSARFSFAPAIQNANTKNQLYAVPTGALANGNSQGIQGSSIDTREVLVNLDGAFGTVSFGRTLSIFGRQAILKDMTLFGVGIANGQAGSVTAGRIGRGYTYPNFNARFSYKTPNLNGLQAEVGLYDPSIEQLNSTSSTLNQTDTPRFEGEVSYTSAFSGGSFQLWADGLWQNIESTGLGLDDDVTVAGYGVGAEAKYMGFALTGYYYGGEGLGRSLQFVGGTACNTSQVTIGTRTFGAGTACESTDNDGFYVQGSYTFNGKTKIGASYGESTEDAFSDAAIRLSNSGNEMQMRDVELSMWTVGVYHDVNSWLKFIAEYSHSENDFGINQFTRAAGASAQADTFSVGSFFFW